MTMWVQRTFAMGCVLIAFGQSAVVAADDVATTEAAETQVRISESIRSSDILAKETPSDGAKSARPATAPASESAQMPPTSRSVDSDDGLQPPTTRVGDERATASVSVEGSTTLAAVPVSADLGHIDVVDWRSRLDANDPLFLLCLIFALISLGAVGITFWLYRWRRWLVGNEAVLVPERWAAAIDRQTQTHEHMAAVIERRHQESWAKLGDLNQTIDAMRQAVTERDEDIRRLREGQDTFVFQKFLHRFIKVSREFDAQLCDEEGADAELLRDLLWQAIEECGVERFVPEVGSDYLQAKGVADRPAIDESTDATKHNKISRIIEPGYCIPSGNNTTVLLPAQVAVWRVSESNSEQE